MLDELILHIGTHKTGSTSIQATCANEARHLRKLGITYPKRLQSSTGHHELVWALRQDAKRRFRDHTPQQIADGYLRECSSNSTSRLLISTEELCRLDRNQIEHVKEIFPARAYRVVVFFRRQDRYLESAFKQQAKAQKTAFKYGLLEWYLASRFFERLDYQNIISDWSHSIEGVQFDLNAYEAAQAHRHGLLGLFYKSLGLSWSDALQRRTAKSRNSNISLSSTSTLALSRINKSNEIDLKTYQNIYDTLLATDCTSSNARRSLMSYGERHAAYRAYWKQNRELLEALELRPQLRHWRWNEEDEKNVHEPSEDEIQNRIQIIENLFPKIRY